MEGRCDAFVPLAPPLAYSLSLNSLHVSVSVSISACVRLSVFSFTHRGTQRTADKYEELVRARDSESELTRAPETL